MIKGKLAEYQRMFKLSNEIPQIIAPMTNPTNHPTINNAILDK